MNKEIYDQQGNLLENPDMELGWLKPSARTVHHDAVEYVPDQFHYEVIREYPNGGKDVERVVDVPGVEAQEAWDEEIPILVYIPYTEEELENLRNPVVQPTLTERVSQLETENGQLKEALELLLSGETEEEVIENA